MKKKRDKKAKKPQAVKIENDASSIALLIEGRSGSVPKNKTVIWNAVTGCGKTQKMIELFCQETVKIEATEPIFYACDTTELALEFILNVFNKMENLGMRPDNIKTSLDRKYYYLFELTGVRQSDLISAMKKRYEKRYSKPAWSYIENLKCYASFSEEGSPNAFQIAKMNALKASRLLITTHESLSTKARAIATRFRKGFIDEVPGWVLNVDSTKTAGKGFIKDVMNFKYDHKAGRELRTMAAGIRSGMLLAEEVLDKKGGENDGWVVTRFNYQKHPFDLLIIATAFPDMTPLAELSLHGGEPLQVYNDLDNPALAEIYRRKNTLSILGSNASMTAIQNKHADKIAADIDLFGADGKKVLIVATAKVEAILKPKLTITNYEFIRTNRRGINSYSDVAKVYIASDINFEPTIRKYYAQQFGEESTKQIETQRSAGMNIQSMFRGAIRNREEQHTRIVSPTFRCVYTGAIERYITQVPENSTP